MLHRMKTAEQRRRLGLDRQVCCLSPGNLLGLRVHGTLHRMHAG